MVPETLIPQQTNTFWASTTNKQNLQEFVKVTVKRFYDPILLSSVIIENEIRPAKLFSNGLLHIIDTLSQSWLEEADERLIIHVGWAVEEKNVKDQLYYQMIQIPLPYFFIICLEELWQKFSTGEKKRLIPMHCIMESLGVSFSKIMALGIRHMALGTCPYGR